MAHGRARGVMSPELTALSPRGRFRRLAAAGSLMVSACVLVSCGPAPEESAPLVHDTSTLSPTESIKTERFVEAERQLREALDSTRPAAAAERARIHHLLALALSGQGRFDAALVEIEAAARYALNNPEVHRAFGNILLKQDRAVEAVDRYHRALELAAEFQRRTGLAVPDLHRWRYELAQALTRAGRAEEARIELAEYERQQAAEIELRNLSRQEEDQGRSIEEANEAIRKLQPGGRSP